MTAARSEPCRRKARTLPTAPPRTRSRWILGFILITIHHIKGTVQQEGLKLRRSQSRVSVRSADHSAPTPPPRSRRNSRASSSRHATLERPGAPLASPSTCTFSSDTIPPTPPPRVRSRPHSRSSARGRTLTTVSIIINHHHLCVQEASPSPRPLPRSSLISGSLRSPRRGAPW